MKVEVKFSGTPSFSEGVLEFDPEFDDARTLVSAICQSIHDTDVGEFVVSGFGDNKWPVDVFADLPAFLEQLPASLLSLESGDETFQLDFYEQGVERYLHFKRVEGDYEITCQSLTDWQPSSVEKLSSVELLEMFNSVKQEFLRVAKAAPMSQKAREVLDKWADMGSVSH